MPSIQPISIAAPRIEPHAGVFDDVATTSNPADIELKFLRDLWQAALGTGDRADADPAFVPSSAPQLVASLQTLLTAQMMGGAPEPPSTPGYDGPLTLGGNSIYASRIEAAGRRTGLAPALLASIISAEANSRDGVWDPQSRNPRSSAAGLTQFLASTWESETERPGTWLNRVAAGNNWLDAKGRVLAEFRPALMDLRFNPTASIEAAADYAASNIQALAADGLVPRGASNGTLAKVAYLAHHLGQRDAARFLNGGIPDERARVLLTAQIGAEAADARIASSGSGSAAHRAWLAGYIETKITPERFTRT